jgi:hypothetical protein
LSIPNILLDASDLVFNQRGIGWSWSIRPSPRAKEPSPSIATALVKLLFKLILFDTAHYLMQSIRPSLNELKGDSLFDPTMSPIPRYALAACLGTCVAVVIYTTVDGLYHFAKIIGRLLLQPEWAWPPLSDRPWTSTSIIEFWSSRCKVGTVASFEFDPFRPTSGRLGHLRYYPILRLFFLSSLRS